MTVSEAIEARRSIRKYGSRPIEPEKLAKVLDAARLAPSAGNAQHWKFIVVTDPAIKGKLMELCGRQKFIAEAPAVLVAVGTKPGIMTNGQQAHAVDLSIALAFAILEACEQGLGTCWVAMYEQHGVKKLLGIPENASVVAVTPIGYAAETPSARTRKGRSEVVCFDRFQ